jgi:hypothetical protein
MVINAPSIINYAPRVINYLKKKQVYWFKSSLLLRIDLQNVQALQLN